METEENSWRSETILLKERIIWKNQHTIHGTWYIYLFDLPLKSTESIDRQVNIPKNNEKHILSVPWMGPGSQCFWQNVFTLKLQVVVEATPRDLEPPKMVRFLYDSHIFRDSYGSGMGIEFVEKNHHAIFFGLSDNISFITRMVWVYIPVA